jgi:hypothetical protein
MKAIVVVLEDREVHAKSLVKTMPERLNDMDGDVVVVVGSRVLYSYARAARSRRKICSIDDNTLLVPAVSERHRP